MTSIATGTGDDGDTGILGSGRLEKFHPRIEAYGCVDELNSELGVCISTSSTDNSPFIDRTRQELVQIQSLLFSLGADLAQLGCGLEGGNTPRVELQQVEMITGWIHAWESDLPPLKEFILPGGDPLSARLHRARTTCRRAERRTVEFSRSSGEGKSAIVFLNRISDLLFLQARAANLASGIDDCPWRPEEKS
jgi:cob(I)alamin adenosyltransferase